MDIFKNIADSVTKTVNCVVDQNRKIALINRLKIVIANEKETKARAYIALGKYYYENLRDAENESTERFCEAAENSDRRLKKAYEKLNELVRPAEEEKEDSRHCECGDTEHSAEQSAEKSAEQSVGEPKKSSCGEAEPNGFSAESSEPAPPVEAARATGEGEAADEGFPPA